MQIDIKTTIHRVLKLQDLTPSLEVNTVMTDLVRVVIDTTGTGAQSISPLVREQVRSISAKAETEMEKFWAKSIVASPNPLEALRSFPYLDNYVELTKRELALVAQSGLIIDAICSVLVIGSGPLPLSAYEINRQTKALVDHVDSSPVAIDFCTQISSALSLDSRHYLARGQEVVLDKQYDVILVAALAGETVEAKQLIINNVLAYLKPSGRLILRSARGSRGLLYPVIKAVDLRNIVLLEEYHPQDHIINSVFVYGK